MWSWRHLGNPGYATEFRAKVKHIYGLFISPFLDLRGFPSPRPHGPKIFSISCSFFGNFGKMVCWRPPLRGNPGSTSDPQVHFQPFTKTLIVNKFGIRISIQQRDTDHFWVCWSGSMLAAKPASSFLARSAWFKNFNWKALNTSVNFFQYSEVRTCHWCCCWLFLKRTCRFSCGALSVRMFVPLSHCRIYTSLKKLDSASSSPRSLFATSWQFSGCRI